jgi:Putative Actinobacterial Holin-X, holin superfamily III
VSTSIEPTGSTVPPVDPRSADASLGEVIAGVAALIGKKKVNEAGPAVPERTVASVKEDVAEIKESIQR